MSKICSNCKIEKPRSLFGRNRGQSSGLDPHCKECRKNRAKKYYLKNKKIIDQRYHNKIKKNPDLMEKRRAYGRLWMKNNTKKRREQFLKFHFGISIDTFNNMYRDQLGNCLICFRNESELSRPLVVDHCHKTKKVRGLLCGQCNSAIGLFREEVSVLKSAINYLNKNRKV